MKPLYLQFNGINSFSEPAEIDFGELLSDGLFGIFGDTGSGKSTILDCITFALYGTVARTPRGGAGEIINHRLDKAFVNFEFGIEEAGKRKRYRVERTVKRKNAVQTLKVIDCESGLVLAEGVREGGALLERIVGLSEEDFERCIVLPQGEFAQFIKSQRADRLKLVTRLFDLEEYGEKLSKRASASFARLSAELSVVRARLEPFGEISEEGLKALAGETERLQAEEKERRAAFEAARERRNRAAELYKRQLEAQRVEARLRVLEEQAEEIALLERELGRTESAGAVSRAKREADAAEGERRAAEENRRTAERAAKEGEALLASFPKDEEEKLDEELARLTELRAAAASFEQTAKRMEELNAQLTRARTEYAAENAQFRGFDYEAERLALEKRREELGSEDLCSFAERHARGLFRGEYAAFAGELKEISRKYPETAEDVLPLVNKYTALSEGERGDLMQLKAQFDARERERGEVRDALLELEKKNGMYRSHRERLLRLQTEGIRLKEELSGLSLPEGFVPAAEAERALEAKRAEKRERSAAREAASRRHLGAQAALAAAAEREKAAGERAERARLHLNEELERGGFSSVAEAEALLARTGGEGARERVKKFREERAALLSRREELSGEELSGGTPEALKEAEEALRTEGGLLEETVRLLALRQEELRRSGEQLARKRELEKEEGRIAHQTELAERLKRLLEGNKFMEYVAEEYLQDITERASTRLLSLTSGQYFLRYDKGFLVGDNLNGGVLRAVYTLSGGETFLVSLSLALALSTEICIRAARPIEFFFLDEGFGTLDSTLVDTVMDSLEKLKGASFSIGIISHVEELKHRIEKKLLVEKATDRHGSKIKF